MDCLTASDLRYLDYGPVDFTLQHGQTLGVSGVSGSGKSLLLKAIGDLIDSQGDVILGDTNRWDISPSDWRARVMLVPAEPQWWFDTVGEHLPEDASPYWRELGFGDEVLKKSVIELSSGEKQRLGLVRALCRCPEALLLDEPTANLDPENTRLVERCVKAYLEAGNRVGVWVSHDRAQLERVGDLVATIENKQFTQEAVR